MDLRVLRPSTKQHRGYRTRDQPPTRTARRNGFGVTGAPAPAIKNLQRGTVQVGVSERIAAFRGGDDARVHLQDCQGGGLRCAARCLGCSTHSLPQVMSAGRNLITVFSSVNTLVELFSGPSAHASNADACVRWAIGAHALACERLARNLNFTKVLFFSTFDSCHRQCADSRQKRIRVSPAVVRMPIRPQSGCKIICAGTRVFASHQPICAEMRKRFVAAKHPIHTSEAAARPQKNPRRRRRGFDVHDRKRYFRVAARASAKASRSTACLVSVVQTSSASPC